MITTPAGMVHKGIEFDVGLLPDNTRRVISDLIAENGYEVHLLAPPEIRSGQESEVKPPTAVLPTHLHEEEGRGRHYLVSLPGEESLHYVGFLRDANTAKEVSNTAIFYFSKRALEAPFKWNHDGDPKMEESGWLSTFQLKARWVRDEAPGSSHMRRDKMELLVQGPSSWLIEASYGGLRKYIHDCKESDHPKP